jgi:hypothetical protein
LLVEHDAVGHHDHAVEHALVRGVVQRREAVREPADRIALTAAGRMLDEVVVPRPLGPRRHHQPPHGVELVVAREDHRLDLHLATTVGALLLDLQVDEAGENVEQAVALERLLP